MKNFVGSAISNTKKMLQDYWVSTCKNRLSGGVGSVYDQFSSVEELEKAI